MGPSWSGVESAHSQICRPSASSRATPKSSDSRMIEEYDIRVSLWPTSRTMLSSAPAITRAVIGSIFGAESTPRGYSMTSTTGAITAISALLDADQDVGRLQHLGAGPGRNHQRGVGLDEHRRTAHAGAHRQPRTLVESAHHRL